MMRYSLIGLLALLALSTTTGCASKRKKSAEDAETEFYQRNPAAKVLKDKKNVPGGGRASRQVNRASNLSQGQKPRSRYGAGGTQSVASAASSYTASPALRNPTVNVPRVSGNSQVSLSRASVNGPYVAMTFDDGPHPSNTPRLLDILAQRNIKATFYVVGTNVKRYPHIMRRMIAEGHEVGNHTVNHVSLTKVGDAGVRRELSRAHQTIVDVCGVAPRTYRPPYGAINTRLKNMIFNEYGYTTVMWAVDPRDWQRPGSSVVASRIIEGTRNGSVILAHDIHKPTIDAMPRALDGLLSRNFRFVTVSQLMALQGGASMGPRISAAQ